jgi:hypothetical protein
MTAETSRPHVETPTAQMGQILIRSTMSPSGSGYRASGSASGTTSGTEREVRAVSRAWRAEKVRELL